MLGKLVKYDFKAMSKIMFPIFMVMLGLSLVLGLMLKLRLDNGWVFGFIATAFIVAMIGSGIASIICISNRFNQGLLKNEGYLSFALPVKTGTHIIAKLLNGVIWSVFEGLAVLASICIVGMIAANSKELLEAYRFILKMFGLMDKDVIIGLLHAVSLSTLELIAGVCLIYAAYAIAHLFEKHKSLVMAGVILLFIVLRTMLTTNVIFSDAFGIRPEIWLWYLQSLIPIAVYTFITWFILDKRLNLE
ncbi:MAG: hypothetical protein IJJ00_07800 [Erysipelotrichaceae bacterium]|nr:hypothetical protein [Erysipelotrichaceae bacterium]